MFHNMLITSLTPLSNMKQPGNWDTHAFRTIWPEPRHHKPKENHSIKKTIKKKRNRTAYTTEQLTALEEVFKKEKYISAERRRYLSLRLNVNEKNIKVWFQNKRMKNKNEANEDSSSSYTSVSPPLYNNVSFTPPQYNSYIGTSTYLNVNNAHETDNLEHILSNPYINQIPYISQKIDNYTYMPHRIDNNVSNNENEISSTTHEPLNNIFEELQSLNEPHRQSDMIQPYTLPEVTIDEYDFPAELYQNSSPVGSAFFNDNNIYPTEYYPNEMQYMNYSEEQNCDAYYQNQCHQNVFTNTDYGCIEL